MPAPVVGIGIAAVIYFFVKRILQALGVALITYVGFDFAFDLVTDYLNDRFGELPAAVFSLLQTTNITTAINMLLSFKAARFAFCGFTTKKFEIC